MKTDCGMESWAVHTPAWDDARLCHLAKIPCNFAHIGVMRIFLAPNILPAFSSYCWLIDVSMVFVYRAVTVGETKNIIHLIVLCINKGNNVWSPAFIYGKVVIHLPFSWLTLLSLTWGPHFLFIYLFNIYKVNSVSHNIIWLSLLSCEKHNRKKYAKSCSPKDPPEVLIVGVPICWRVLVLT